MLTVLSPANALVRAPTACLQVGGLVKWAFRVVQVFKGIDKQLFKLIKILTGIFNGPFLLASLAQRMAK